MTCRREIGERATLDLHDHLNPLVGKEGAWGYNYQLVYEKCFKIFTTE